MFLELLFLAGLFYVGALISVWAKDHETNDKWVFFRPAILLGVVIFLLYMNGISLFSVFFINAILPFLISYIYIGSLQDAQIAAGERVYSKGERFWIVSDRMELRDAFIREYGALEATEHLMSGWSEDMELRCGESGVILEVYLDNRVTMEFDDGVQFDFPFDCLTDSAPEIEEAL